MSPSSSPIRRRTVPFSEDAEVAVLGTAMLAPSAFELVVTELDTDDFYLVKHQTIHHAMRSMWESALTIADPVVLADELEATGLLEEAGGRKYLLDMMGNTPSTARATEYARIVLDMATRRRLIGAGTEITNLGYESPEDIAVVTRRAVDLVAEVDVPIIGEPSPNIAQILELEIDYDWLVEGLLERRDRLIITAGEGNGKSTLLRQIALMLAIGMHPFRFYPIDPIKVLVVDLENSASQIKRAYADMMQHVKRHFDPDRLRIECRQEGLDVTSRHDARWLIERVAAAKPDLVITGPIYRLHTADPNEELPARKVIEVLDVIRTKYNAAVIIEAHVPNARDELRPYGASIWRRWPEFGYGLRVDTDAEPRDINGHPHRVFFNAWRGPRDQRQWPRSLNGDGELGWPWRDEDYQAPPQRGGDF